MYTVYKHTNKINGKVYIGITKRSVELRWGKNGIHYYHQTFGRAIKKYGWDNFNHDILFTGLTEEEAKLKEKELIKECKSNIPTYGYNVTSGGDGCFGYRFSDEQKAEMSKRAKLRDMTGERNPNYGNGDKIRGNKNPNYKGGYYVKVNIENGVKTVKIQSRKTNNVNSKNTIKNLDDVAYKQFIEKLSIAFSGGNNPTAKRCVIDGKEFECIKFCAEYLNVQKEVLVTWVSGKNPMPKELYNRGLRCLDDNIEYRTSDYVIGKGRGMKIKCGDLIFDSAKECAEHIGVKPRTLNAWLSPNSKNKMPKIYEYLNIHYYTYEEYYEDNGHYFFI